MAVGTGADLENTSLAYLDRITAASNGSVKRQNAVLGASAERLVDELSGIYGKIQTKGTGTYEAQQVNARLQNLGDLLSKKDRDNLTGRMKADLAAAEGTGRNSSKELSKLLGATGETLKQNAAPNVPAINNAGTRLNDFWAKENTLFRDRVTAMTQAAAAEGKSWRKLAAEVRELLLLERKAGTESARSTRVNARLGITSRAELIARTEMQTAYVQGQLSQYREMGYSWVRWSATAERSCPFCISRDGLLYEIGDVESAIPAHPRCRCSLIPADPPANFKKSKQKGADAYESLDDAYWAKSRAEKIRDFRKANPRFTDAMLRDYVRTPTNSQAYLRPGTPAPAPAWAPSGSLSPNLEQVVLNGRAAAQRAAEAEATKKAEAAKKAEAEIPEEIKAAGLVPAWKQMAGNPELQGKLLEQAKKLAVKKAAEDAKKAKEADAAQKKAQNEAKAAEIKAAGIKSLEALGLTTAQATKAWDRTQGYVNQGMGKQEAAQRAIKELFATGKSGKPVNQDVLDRIQAKQLIDPKGHGKVGKADIASAFDLMATLSGEAGANFRRMAQFQERHNITSLWGIGGKATNKGQTEHLRSKQLLSSVNSALARKDGQTSYMTQVQKELRSYVNGGSPTGLVWSNKILKQDSGIGVGGATGQGFGFIKVRLDGKSAKFTQKDLAKYQDDIVKGIEAAAKGTPLNNTNSAGQTWKTAGKYKVMHSDKGWVNTYIHEMGHQVHYMAGMPLFKGSYKPSKYGASNHKEWFAETFVQYTVAPQALKKLAPDAYAFVDKVMKRVMQSTPGQWSRYNQNKTANPTDFFNKDLSQAAVKKTGKTLKDLQAEAKALGLKGYSKLKKSDLQQLLNDQGAPATPAPAAPAKPTSNLTVKQLQAEAKALGLKGYSKLNKAELIKAVEGAFFPTATPAPAPAPAPKPKPKTKAQLQSEIDVIEKAFGTKIDFKLYKNQTPENQKKLFDGAVDKLKEPAPAAAPAPKPLPKQRVAQQPPSATVQAGRERPVFQTNGDLKLGGEIYKAGATLAGSTAPKLYSSGSGKQLVVKGGGAKGQNFAEHAAQEIYRVMSPGNALKSRLVDGKLVNEFVKGGTTLNNISAYAKDRISRFLRGNSAVDMLLANWDVKGLTNDNIMVGANGSIVKIDAGGTFNFRAQGGKKDYTALPRELFTLRAKGKGQLAKEWENATEADYKDLYDRQMNGLWTRELKLRKVVKNSKLDQSVQVAFIDRLDAFAALGDIAGNMVALKNGQTFAQAVKEGKFSYKQLDAAVKNAWDYLGSQPQSLQGGPGWRGRVRNAVLNEIDVAMAAAAKAAPAPKPAAAPKPSDTYATPPKDFQAKPLKTLFDVVTTVPKHFQYMTLKEINNWLMGSEGWKQDPSTPDTYAKNIADLQVEASKIKAKLQAGEKLGSKPKSKGFDYQRGWQTMQDAWGDLNPVKSFEDFKKLPPDDLRMAMKMSKNEIKKNGKKAGGNLFEQMFGAKDPGDPMGAGWPSFKVPNTPDELFALKPHLKRLNPAQLQKLIVKGSAMIFDPLPSDVHGKISSLVVSAQEQKKGIVEALRAKGGAKVKPKTTTKTLLEGDDIAGKSTAEQIAFVKKWNKAGGDVIDGAFKTGGATSKALLSKAKQIEQAHLTGKTLLEGQLAGKTITELKKLAKDTGITGLTKVTEKDEVLKFLYVAQGAKQSLISYKPLKKTPAEAGGLTLPAGLTPTKDYNPNAIGEATKTHPLFNGRRIAFNYATDFSTKTYAQLREELGLLSYQQPSTKYKQRVKATTDDGKQTTTNTGEGLTLERAQRNGYSDAQRREITQAVRSWSGSSYGSMRDQQFKKHGDLGWEYNPGSMQDKAAKRTSVSSSTLKKAELAEKYISLMPKYKGPVIRDVGASTLADLKAILADYVSGAPVGAMESWAYERGSYETGKKFRLRLVDRENKHGASMTAHSSFGNGEREILKPAGMRYRLPDDAIFRQYNERGVIVYEVEVVGMD